MVRILHYITSLNDWKGGVEAFVINTYKGLKDVDCCFEILTRHSNPESDLHKELLNNGIVIHDLDVPHLNSPLEFYKFKKRLNTFFNENEGRYVFLHSHRLEEPYVIAIAQKHRVIHIGVHAHAFVREKNTNFMYSFIKNICEKNNIKRSEFRFACSDQVGLEIFKGYNYKVIKNTIDVNDYSFDEVKRRIIRKKYNIENKIVIGFVGRLSKIKNVNFLIDIYKSLNDSRMVLLIVGDGEEKENLEKQASINGISNGIFFVGSQIDVCSYLSAMDLYIQPSISEGFSISLLEAQCNGLISFASDVIPPDVNITDLYHPISLDKTAIEWAEIILDVFSNFKITDRTVYKNIITQACYDTKTVSMGIFEECYSKK